MTRFTDEVKDDMKRARSHRYVRDGYVSDPEAVHWRFLGWVIVIGVLGGLAGLAS